MKRYQIIGLAVLLLAGLSPGVYAGNDGWRRDRDRGDRNRCDRGRRCPPWWNNWNSCDNDNNYSSDYYPNNYNYLGYPPWYRLNYYTPWMSDYRNGTAWTKIPTSHAAEGYGLPSSLNTMPSGYYAWLASGGGGAINTGYAPNYSPNMSAAYPNAGYNNPQAANALAGNDIVVVVQRELRRRGFYQGLVNGISDSATRTAIRAYESSAGLPATGGIIGLDLLRSLGVM
jgi:hypothetical protein